MNTNEGIKRGNSRTKLYQTLFISLNYRLQTELNVHPLINFFLLRDNQFTSVGLHSTIVLKTQVHSNTPCWGLKNLKKKLKKKTVKIITTQRQKHRADLLPFSAQPYEKTWIFIRADPILNGHLMWRRTGPTSRYVFLISKHTRIWRTPVLRESDHSNCVL